jgi:hypothetical protein
MIRWCPFRRFTANMFPFPVQWIMFTISVTPHTPTANCKMAVRARSFMSQSAPHFTFPRITYVCSSRSLMHWSWKLMKIKPDNVWRTPPDFILVSSSVIWTWESIGLNPLCAVVQNQFHVTVPCSDYSNTQTKRERSKTNIAKLLSIFLQCVWSIEGLPSYSS